MIKKELKMKIFKIRFHLHDLEDNNIYLKLTRNKLFAINPFYLYCTWDNDGVRNLDLFIKESNKEMAEKKLISFIHLLNFMYHMDISIAESLYVSEVKDLPDTELIEGSQATNKNIILLNNVFSKINQYEGKEYKMILQCIRYFSRSLKLVELELFEESLLTGFKAIELISNKIFKDQYKEKFTDSLSNILPNILKENFNEDFSGQGKDKEINERVINISEELITTRRKVGKALEYLNLTKYKNDIGEIIRQRNKVGAHSSVSNSQVDIKLVAKTQYIARKVITKYLFGDKYEILRLEGYKKY